jgi:thiamine biosynthesis lipoprotein ApbE
VLSAASFPAMGCENTVVLEDAELLPEAAGLVAEELERIEQACSRFREGSELSILNAAEGGDFHLSPLLEEAIAAALLSAEMSLGLVDPTVGGCLREVGYTVTFRDLPPDGPALNVRIREVAGWRSLLLDREAHTLRVPEGVSIDLGASGKAWAADRAAGAVAGRLGAPVAVVCGGDVAVRGPAPVGGWPVRVTPRFDAEEWQDVAIFDGGLATSGPGARRWRRGGVEYHHIIDPATGLPAQTPWTMVSVAAASCLEANAAATAAVILGDAATGWLEELGLPSRLVDDGGGVHLTGGWRDR